MLPQRLPTSCQSTLDTLSPFNSSCVTTEATSSKDESSEDSQGEGSRTPTGSDGSDQRGTPVKLMDFLEMSSTSHQARSGGHDEVVTKSLWRIPTKSTMAKRLVWRQLSQISRKMRILLASVTNGMTTTSMERVGAIQPQACTSLSVTPSSNLKKRSPCPCGAPAQPTILLEVEWIGLRSKRKRGRGKT
jgi:hypothetical protein